MPSAQDHAFALLVAQRGVVSSEALAQAKALVQQRGASGQTLAQALLELRLLGPAAVAEALRELARSSFVCEPCHDLRGYDALARLPALQCPTCGRALAIVATAPRESRLTHTLGDTAAGGAPLQTPPPRTKVDTTSRPSGAWALPSGAFGALPAGSEAGPIDGRMIGPYQVVRELGRGSNGVVFLARRPGLERRFAVKMLLREHADREAVQRFQQEATIASKIDDPGIIGVFDVGRHGAHDYYAMEYCPGVTLEDRLKRGALSPDEAGRVVEQLARTVQAAHKRGIIHRDLKPANVILEEGSGRPRILDFGLARDRAQDQKLTRSGDVLGTPYYMAPEQIRGDRDLDHRIDVYALGVILYECLTGRRPFEATSVIELAQKIRGEEPPAPRALRPDLPERLEATCLRAMAKRRDVRHPTARHLADDLAGLRAAPAPANDHGESSGAIPPGPRRGLVAWLAGAAALAAVSAALALVATAPGAGSTPGPTPPPATTEPADRAAEVARHLDRAQALSRQRASEAAVAAELDRALELTGDDARAAAAVRLAQAALLSRRGKFREANQLAADLADGPDAPADLRAEALRIVAHGQDRLGDVGAARASWARLREADAGAPGRTAAAALARLAGDAAAHRELAAQAARQDPAYAPALMERAVAERLHGDLDAALAAARQATEAWPDCVTSHLLLGLTALAREDRRGARAAFDDAIRLGEPEPEAAALTARARLSAEEGRLETALADLDRVLARDADAVEALVLRGLVLWSLATIGDAAERRAGAEDAWRRAHAADPELFLRVADGLTPQVRAAARQAAGVSPGVRAGERAPVAIGPEVRARLERWSSAVPDPARRPLLQALGAAAEGQPLARFEAWLREAVAAAPDSGRLALLEARLLEGRDAYDPAQQALERARGLGAPAAALDLVEGELLWFRGRGNDAAKAWDALAHREPSDAHGLCAAAWSYFAREDADAAVRTAAEALRKAPELTSALVVQGLAHELLDRHAEARACYERVLALEGAVYGRVPLFALDVELKPLVEKVSWRGASTPEIDERMERLVSLFGLGGATTRLVAVNNALALGPGTVWFGRCHEWLDDAQRAEPWRAELDMWHGWVALHERGTRAEDVLKYWRRAREQEPRIVLSKAMRETFKQRFGDNEELATFPEK